MKKNKKTVFVGMSGGVDSSVAALLLKNRGYNVIGIFMRCFNVDGCAEQDAEDARRVAEKLKIPFYVWDFEEEYKKKVVDYMVDGYRKGITPNPDVMCNKEIKFGLFLKKALEMGADYVATGHYVRLAKFHRTKRRGLAHPAIRSSLNSRPRSLASLKPYSLGLRDTFLSDETSPQFSLLEAKDKTKDQSYFLWTLTQEQLKHCLFPIGDYLKSEARQIAKKAGLITADKKDSQGICFLGKITLDDFLSHYISPQKGDVLNVSGEKIGEHKGAHFYTIGQRRGLGISGNKPYYVAWKNTKTNSIILAEENNYALYKKEIELKDLNLISPLIFSSSLPAGRQGANSEVDVLARVRYRQPLARATFYLKNKGARLVFDESVKFVAPGQSAVFYSQKGELFGGGIIV